ncbi:MAG: MOSC domain-containing protein [Actinomycetota bacterium]
MSARVEAVHRSAEHRFSKQPQSTIELVAGLGIEGDAHQGAQVKHRSRVRADPTQPNLRQVHLLHAEILDRVADQGFTVAPGDLGENITTRGLDLLDLPVATTLAIGSDVLLSLTGLRNPCGQIDGFQSGLRQAFLDQDADGEVLRLAGVMAVVVRGGTVRPDDAIAVARPPEPHHRLERV